MSHSAKTIYIDIM